MLNKEYVINILKTIIYPEDDKDIVSLDFVKNIEIKDNKSHILIDIPSSEEETKKTLEDQIKNALGEDTELLIRLKKTIKENSKTSKNIAPQIKNFIMISSGKGGVGKSTSSVNLAIALAMQGKKVGLLDADIYGPNIPRMLGIEGAKTQGLDNKILPVKAYGLEIMSIGLLVESGRSLIWRGAMIMKAIEQFLKDILWGNLDALIIDMPPGTGDAQLTLAQSIPVTAGLTVTTPQMVSIDDSKRSLDMFEKLNIPIAGVIENMSGFICPDNGKEYEIFGKGGTQELVGSYKTEILAKVPIEIDIREGGDNGKPVVYHKPYSKSAKEYLSAADKIWNFVENINKENKASNEGIQPIKGSKPACSK